eukprot:TRINITY_DN3474_c0_g1_i1.p2 TRINITY_DN3474_c0_g1~~TRINITY_DN3474_c0_g1_i1.p2  ORF type:complete len:291 (+),score=103.91 TRINITY_DN3474_c0_g1_i1:40-873(+)
MSKKPAWKVQLEAREKEQAAKAKADAEVKAQKLAHLDVSGVDTASMDVGLGTDEERAEEEAARTERHVTLAAHDAPPAPPPFVFSSKLVQSVPARITADSSDAQLEHSAATLARELTALRREPRAARATLREWAALVAPAASGDKFEWKAPAGGVAVRIARDDNAADAVSAACSLLDSLPARGTDKLQHNAKLAAAAAKILADNGNNADATLKAAGRARHVQHVLAVGAANAERSHLPVAARSENKSNTLLAGRRLCRLCIRSTSESRISSNCIDCK